MVGKGTVNRLQTSLMLNVNFGLDHPIPQKLWHIFLLSIYNSFLTTQTLSQLANIEGENKTWKSSNY